MKLTDKCPRSRIKLIRAVTDEETRCNMFRDTLKDFDGYCGQEGLPINDYYCNYTEPIIIGFLYSNPTAKSEAIKRGWVDEEEQWVDVTKECKMEFSHYSHYHIRLSHNEQWLMEIGINSEPSICSNGIKKIYEECIIQGTPYKIVNTGRSCSHFDRFKVMMLK